jgi:hypothetical protein
MCFVVTRGYAQILKLSSAWLTFTLQVRLGQLNAADTCFVVAPWLRLVKQAEFTLDDMYLAGTIGLAGSADMCFDLMPGYAYLRLGKLIQPR